MMTVMEKPPLSPSSDRGKVQAVLEAVSAPTPEHVMGLTAGEAEMSPGLSFSGIETSPDTVFFNPDESHFEAAATVYVVVGGGGRFPMTESFPAVVKGSVTKRGAKVDAVMLETPEFYEAG
jgi:hypothetical protein